TRDGWLRPRLQERRRGSAQGRLPSARSSHGESALARRAVRGPCAAAAGKPVAARRQAPHRRAAGAGACGARRGRTRTAGRGKRRSELDSHRDGATIVEWTEDPFARGAYAYELAGAPPDLAAQLAAPERETLFFAGEATSLIGRGGTVDGAVETGRRAARELL